MENNLKEKLDKDGFAVIEDFLTEEDCDELKNAGIEFTKGLLDDDTRVVFPHLLGKQDFSSKYLLDSNDKIRAFFINDAIGAEGELTKDPLYSLNKVGHALHYLHPAFRRVTYSDKVKQVCRELELRDPAVVQSMYIYKNPGEDGTVLPHRDASYLFTEPIPPIGFWIPIEDATLENACLQMVPGSHKDNLDMRVTCKNENDNEVIRYDQLDKYDNKYVAVPVKKGSCILIHGNVVHKSEPNRSKRTRHAYTFHVIEKHNNVYSKDNWLKEGPGAPFVSLYETV